MRIEIEGPKETSLTTVGTGPLKSGKKLEPISVGQLVRRLSAMFPPEDAEAWDRTGLLVGDPTQWPLVRGFAGTTYGLPQFAVSGELGGMR